jgi:uncharacterized protein (TIGR02300 family)
MGTVSLGTKRTCSSCGARFFDLLKAPAVCPKCGTAQDAELRRLKPGPPRPVGRRQPPSFVPVEKQEEPQADEADETDEDEIDEPLDEEEDVDDNADDVPQPKLDD